MSVTLNQIYETIRSTEQITLVAGTAGMNHVVRLVHMVEGTDISSFLEGDELAFTTGIALKSKEELMELVQFNYKQNAAGMVINIGPYISQIGEDILKFAEEHAFPVFEVPWQVRMANIMHTCSKLINLDEQKQMEFESALKNAVYFPENQDGYLPAFFNLGYKREWLYEFAIIHIQQKHAFSLEQEEKKKIVKYIKSELHHWKDQIRVLEREDTLILFFANIPEETIRNLLNELWKKVQKYFLTNGGMYVGLGNPTSHLTGIGKCYHQAEQVLVLQKKRNARNQIVLYKELGLYKLLLGMEDTELLQEYYKEHLGKLEKYDRMNETDYMYFLKRYFALGCSVADAAAELHMHRNSITYKLHKVEEITGCSFSDQEIRTRFIVAFMIQEIQ